MKFDRLSALIAKPYTALEAQLKQMFGGNEMASSGDSVFTDELENFSGGCLCGVGKRL